MKHKDIKNDQRDPWERDTYQTGITDPPKHQSGLVAILLVLVIFLSGLASILGILNIKMFSQLYQENIRDAPLALANLDEAAVDSQNEADTQAIVDGTPGLGFTVDAITTVYQRHFQLPEGLFITHVTPGSDAEAQGLQEGDVLLYLDHQKLTDEETLQSILAQKNMGDRLEAQIFRNSTNETLTIQLTVEQTNQN